MIKGLCPRVPRPTPLLVHQSRTRLGYLHGGHGKELDCLASLGTWGSWQTNHLAAGLSVWMWNFFPCRHLDVSSLRSAQQTNKQNHRNLSEIFASVLVVKLIKDIICLSMPGLIFLRGKQWVPWRIRTCVLRHKYKQFTTLLHQTFRVKHTSASWQKSSPWLKLKVPFLKSLEVWIPLTEVSVHPSQSFPGRPLLKCHRKKGLFLYLLRVCVMGDVKGVQQRTD